MIATAPAAANAAVASLEVDKMILNYASAIREKAGSLNLTQLLPIIRGQ